MKLPPLNSLRVFDSAARHEAFGRAAQELHVTHGAVSRQIKLLEEALGLTLFERRNRAVFLTDAGRQLLAVTQGLFEQLRAGLAQLQQPDTNAPLVVSCEPTIAMMWLIPRLPDFQRSHPGVQVHLYAAGGAVDFAAQGVDVAFGAMISNGTPRCMQSGCATNGRGRCAGRAGNRRPMGTTAWRWAARRVRAPGGNGRRRQATSRRAARAPSTSISI